MITIERAIKQQEVDFIFDHDCCRFHTGILNRFGFFAVMTTFDVKLVGW